MYSHMAEKLQKPYFFQKSLRAWLKSEPPYIIARLFMKYVLLKACNVPLK